MLKYLAVAMLGTALMAAPSLAQTSNSANTKAGAQTASASGEWQASKLIHLDVYNAENQKIGDIKELMIDKTGKIGAAVIGVGGFLGMGEHDVAVKFDQLKWADKSNNSNTSSGTTGAANASNTNRTYPDHAVLNATKDQLKAMPNFEYNK